MATRLDLAHPGLAAVGRLRRLAEAVQGCPDGEWFALALVPRLSPTR
jgi:hypothetical protein